MIMMISDDYNKIVTINKTGKVMLIMEVMLSQLMNGGLIQYG